MRKFTLPFLLALLLAAMLATPALAEQQARPQPQPAGTASPRDWDKLAPDGELLGTAVKADSAILMDARTGKVLYEKMPDERRFPASITKIMTCLVALDSKKTLSDIVTVGTLPKLPSDATDIELKKDEQMTLEDLLYGLMLPSGNDAANAIAMYIGDGSIDTFLGMMNAKAQELGMTGTHYMNTNGLHNADHYTTARDMAILAIAAQSYPDFVKIVSTPKYTMETTNKTSKKRIWNNTNKLLSDTGFGYVYTTGIKTGFTNPAMYTLVSSAQKDNVNLVAVLLHSTNNDARWTNSITMFEYGFLNYDTIDLVELLRGQPISADIKNAAASDENNGSLALTLLPKTPKAYITDKKDVIAELKSDTTKFEQILNITKDTAPIKKDEVIGAVSFVYNGTTMLECDLLASRDVAEMPTPAPAPSASLNASGSAAPGTVTSAGASVQPGGTQSPAASGGIGTVLIWVGAALLLLLAALLTIRIINTSRRNKKYRQYNYRQNGTRLRR